MPPFLLAGPRLGQGSCPFPGRNRLDSRSRPMILGLVGDENGRFSASRNRNDVTSWRIGPSRCHIVAVAHGVWTGPEGLEGLKGYLGRKRRGSAAGEGSVRAAGRRLGRRGGSTRGWGLGARAGASEGGGGRGGGGGGGAAAGPGGGLAARGGGRRAGEGFGGADRGQGAGG